MPAAPDFEELYREYLPRIYGFVPSPSDTLELPVDGLALRLLAFQAAVEDESGLASFNLCINRSHCQSVELASGGGTAVGLIMTST